MKRAANAQTVTGLKCVTGSRRVDKTVVTGHAAFFSSFQSFTNFFDENRQDFGFWKLIGLAPLKVAVRHIFESRSPCFELAHGGDGCSRFLYHYRKTEAPLYAQRHCKKTGLRH